MPLINRIEIVNYLCEGWEPSMGVASWRPLWPANLIHLCGASTAIQVPNGAGKTSVTTAVLYLLSRDKALKSQFLERCSPAGSVATHIRIEFAVLLDDDVMQRDLMTPDPRECPAQTYVIGVCANRGDDHPHFYRYPGILEDAPAHLRNGTTLQFCSTETLRASVRKIRTGQWGGWDTIAEWRKNVSMFMSAEVVRQNVQFHKDGAGDASATFNRVTPSPGERFDEAYFRQVVAPRLLTNMMGESAEEGERNVEDTILASMNRFTDAKLGVERQAAYLAGREALEVEFRPVIDAGSRIQGAEADFQMRLQGLAVDAAFLTRFTRARDGRMSGVPRPLEELTLTPEVRNCLKSMVLDKSGQVLIDADGMGQLLGMSAGHLNELATRAVTLRGAVPSAPTSSQVIDFRSDIKIPGGVGGNRHSRRFYAESSALELVARRPGASADLAETLQQAFRTAESLVDSNLFRHRHRQLLAQRGDLKAAAREADLARDAAEKEREALERQVKERQENQGAYQDFTAQLSTLPADLHDAPARVPAWLEGEAKVRTDAVSQHAQRVGRLTHGWEELQSVRLELGLTTLPDAITDLKAERETLEQTRARLAARVETARDEYESAAGELSASQAGLSSVAIEHGVLSEHSAAYDSFLAIFGNADPTKVGPPIEEKSRLEKNRKHAEEQQHTKGRELEKLVGLAEGAARFETIFGAVDPRSADPHKALEVLVDTARAVEATFVHHQPMAEALEDHFDRTSMEPSIWLQERDAAYAAATEAVRVAQAAVAELELELSALDDLTLVGNADYAHAHERLRDAGVDATRVRDVILAKGLSNDETLAQLSALGSLLDAPVVTDMAAAEAALIALANEGLDIPLVLRGPLDEALQGPVGHNTPTAASLSFLAGAKSRRMRAIVDPQALEEERQALQLKHSRHQAEAAAAAESAAANNPHTPGYRQAQRALEAVRLDSPAKAKQAKVDLDALELKIVAAKRLVTPESLRCLDSAVQFLNAGAAEALEATRTALEDLVAAISSIDERLAAIAPLLTQEAMIAHGGARKFVIGGGNARLDDLSRQATTLRQQCAELQGRLPGLQNRLTELRSDASSAEAGERAFMSTFQTRLDRLLRAQAFESGGNADFMSSSRTVLAQLEGFRDALNPLRSINYLRAQAFKDHQGHDELTLQRMIGDARGRRDHAATQAQELTAQADGMEADVIWANQAAEALHELAFFLSARRNALAPFEADLKSRETGTSPPEAHASYATAEAVRLALLAWRPGDAFDLMQIAPLRDDIEAIDVSRTAREVADARRMVGRARDKFIEHRDAFCNKAAGSKDGGFAPAEIEAIRAANTPQDMAALSAISARLRAKLEEELAALSELQQTATTTENASIDNLTRLIENCSGNLTIMKSVMTKNPKAGFIINADIISTADIRHLMVELQATIEVRKRDAAARATLMRRHATDATLGADVRRALIERIFMNPSVQFHHTGIWGGDARAVRASMSEGQKAALQMMWLIKESEYHLECTVRRHVGGGVRKKLRSRLHRVLFFDGLFSNLTERSFIDEAFKGLGDPDSNLQLIGLIHNPEYRNNFSIFPSYVVGRRAGRRDVEGERTFVRFDDGRESNTLGLATFMQKRPPTGQGGADVG